MESKLKMFLFQMRLNIEKMEGETYNFENGKRKCADIIRKSSIALEKINKEFRKEVLAIKKALPVKKRNFSPEKIAAMVAKRKETLAKKKAGKNGENVS